MSSFFLSEAPILSSLPYLPSFLPSSVEKENMAHRVGYTCFFFLYTASVRMPVSFVCVPAHHRFKEAIICCTHDATFFGLGV